MRLNTVVTGLPVNFKRGSAQVAPSNSSSGHVKAT
jgi:hypothetical protein